MVISTTLKRIGDYEPLEKLGQGAMGEVYLARNIKTRNIVAIKLLLHTKVEGIERFKNEHQLLNQIDHKNIIKVLSPLEEHNGTLFFVTEYVPGETLEKLIKKFKRFEEDTAVEIILQILDGIHAAHEKGVIHRDLKPSNVFVDKNLNIKVGDFGIALEKMNMDGYTKTGYLVGTPSYMAPERLKGHKGDIQSDIFSIGVMLYQMVAGKLPFEHTDIFSYIRAVENSQIDLSLLPGGLRDICRKALSTYPSERYKDCAEFADAIRKIPRGEPPGQEKEEIKKLAESVENQTMRFLAPARKPLKLLLAISAVVITAIIGAFALFNGGTEEGNHNSVIIYMTTGEPAVEGLFEGIDKETGEIVIKREDGSTIRIAKEDVSYMTFVNND